MLKRRHFLQLTSSTAATIGLGQWDLARSTQLLAKDAPRKLALLVGINDYPQQGREITPLNGCQTDVQLQTELLVHRFGFDPKNIVTLIDAKATRQNILQQFETHLIAQAQPSDVVVFHFSGHGSRLVDPDPIANRPLNSAFLPFDAGDYNPDGSVNDIMGRTLFLLMSALRTENVTVVLDSCHSGGGTRGQVKIRSVRDGENAKPSPAELDYQQRWQDRLKLSPDRLRALRQAGVAKGMVLAAALEVQTAEDRYFTDNFYAGAFTYTLTQLLWQQALTLDTAQPVIAAQMNQLNGYQKPVFERSPTLAPTSPLFFTPPLGRSSQAVVTQVQKDQVTLWLGGLDPSTIEAFAPGSTFALLDSTGKPNGKATLKSRQGLSAIATMEGRARVGSLLQETDRVISSSFRLRLGVDPSLVSELATIQTRLQSLKRVEVQPFTQSQPVDYILSRVMPASLQPNAPAIGSIALFKPNLELLPNSSGNTPTESLSTALQSLVPTLQSLTAAKLVRQTLNAPSSTLKIRVTIALVKQPNTIVAQAGTGSTPSLTPPSFPVNTPFQIELINQNTFPLYFLVILISPNGQLYPVFPNLWTVGRLDQISEIAPQAKRMLPDPQENDRFTLKQPEVGRSEFLVIASPKPLSSVFRQLTTLRDESNQARTDLVSGSLFGLLADVSSKRDPTSFTVNTGDLATVSIGLNFS
jgi:hypothetical protein